MEIEINENFLLNLRAPFKIMLHYMYSKYSLLALFARSKYLIKSCVFPSISWLSLCPALILCESCVLLVIIIIIILLILILGDDRVIQRGTGLTMWRLCMKKKKRTRKRVNGGKTVVDREPIPCVKSEQFTSFSLVSIFKCLLE